MKIAIAGGCGRMGKTLIEAVKADRRLMLSGVSERDKEALKSLAAAYGRGVVFTNDPRKLAEAADAVIDFTSPEASIAMAEAVAKKGGIHIIGTTGFTPTQQKKIKTLASHARIVQSGNFSLGVNLVENLVKQAAKLLGSEYDIEIFEMHHKHKKDAPSGTALMLGRAAAAGREVEFEKKKSIGREGARKPGDIGFSVARGGDVVGIHTVTFAGPGEVIEIRHQGFDRGIYAAGALKAALWAKAKKPGLYSMQDVLGL